MQGCPRPLPTALHAQNKAWPYGRGGGEGGSGFISHDIPQLLWVADDGTSSGTHTIFRGKRTRAVCEVSHREIGPSRRSTPPPPFARCSRSTRNPDPIASCPYQGGP